MSARRRHVAFPPGAVLERRNTLVIDEHADEAAFQWLTRARAVRSSAYGLRDLARLDERVEAHLQGLVVAAEDGWAAAEALLADGPAGSREGALFVAVHLAVLAGRRDRLELALSAAHAMPTARRAIASGMGWATWSSAAPPARALVATSGELEKLVGLDAHRVHRQDPGDLGRLLDDPSPAVRAAAARLAGEVGLAAHVGALRPRLVDPDAEVRVAAAWAAARLPAAPHDVPHDVVSQLVAAGAEDARGAAAIDMAARCMTREQAIRFVGELRRRATPWLWFVAAAAAGWPELIEDLVAAMAEDRWARGAGSAFEQITGADLDYLDLARDVPPDDDEPAGEPFGPPVHGVAPAPLDLRPDLPLPDPKRVAAWWREHRGSWRLGVRYLAGRPVERSELKTVLRDGNQPQRRAAALELARAEPAACAYDTSRPGLEQARDLLGWS